MNILKIASRTDEGIAFWVCLVTSITLMVWGFLTPPEGEIDASVLKGCGILLMFVVCRTFLKAIQIARSTKITHGDTSIEIVKKDSGNGNNSQENVSE